MNGDTKPLKWKTIEGGESNVEPIPGLEEFMSDIRNEMQMARQEEEEILIRIKNELEKTEKTLGGFNVCYVH